jgi:hypothetical protein
MHPKLFSITTTAIAQHPHQQETDAGAGLQRAIATAAVNYLSQALGVAQQQRPTAAAVFPAVPPAEFDLNVPVDDDLYDDDDDQMTIGYDSQQQQQQQDVRHKTDVATLPIVDDEKPSIDIVVPATTDEASESADRYHYARSRLDRVKSIHGDRVYCALFLSKLRGERTGRDIRQIFLRTFPNLWTVYSEYFSVQNGTPVDRISQRANKYAVLGFRRISEAQEALQRLQDLDTLPAEFRNMMVDRSKPLSVMLHRGFTKEFMLAMHSKETHQQQSESATPERCKIGTPSKVIHCTNFEQHRLVHPRRPSILISGVPACTPDDRFKSLFDGFERSAKGQSRDEATEWVYRAYPKYDVVPDWKREHAYEVVMPDTATCDEFILRHDGRKIIQTLPDGTVNDMGTLRVEFFEDYLRDSARDLFDMLAQRQEKKEQHKASNYREIGRRHESHRYEPYSTSHQHRRSEHTEEYHRHYSSSSSYSYRRY